MKKEEDNLGRLLVLLLLTLAICLGMYWLPDRLLGFKIKRVDLLSDLRIKPDDNTLDSLRLQLAEADTLQIDSVQLRDSIRQQLGIDSVALALRDSLYQALYAMSGADSLGTYIEDYSVGHIGLMHFFAQLNRIHELDRPVRIAFLGDSFIEGDILVGDFRSAMQQQFGGRGVGFVPIQSVAAQYRPTVKIEAEGWTQWSMLTDEKPGYTLSGMLFEPEGGEATLSVKSSERYPELEECGSVKLLYEQNRETQMSLVCNGTTDTLHIALPAATRMSQYEQLGTFREAHFRFTQADGFRALGVAMEDNSGVVVDNFSLRGNSGMILDRLDSLSCLALDSIRPYDLIILQYGLNVANDDVIQYGWYGTRMVQVVKHLRNCFPRADILMLSVSDRSRQENGGFETMPAVLALLHAQRKAAKQAGIPFWNLFGAMGGENSMVRYVENNWASKDYTHLSFRGGKEIAEALMRALMQEKEFYDEAEKMEP